MNAGKMNARIGILSLAAVAGGYAWAQDAEVWAKSEPLEKTNLFSKVGIGAKSVKFTMRKQTLTLHNAIRWGGKHCFLTDIAETDDRGFYEVTAALAEPAVCVCARSKVGTGEMNRVEETPDGSLSFPACMVEKYAGFERVSPYFQVEMRYVLVTPKVVSLAVNDVVTVKDGQYAVQLAHMTDEYKNEYEISRVGDA